MAQTCVTPLVARHSLPVRHRRHRRHRHRRQPPSGQPAQFKRQCASILAQMRVRVGETLACGNHKVIKSCLHSKLRRITSQSSGCRDVVIASAASKYTMPLISSHFISWTKENLASPRVEQTDPMCDLGLHHPPPIARYPANHSPQTARSVSLSLSLSLSACSLCTIYGARVAPNYPASHLARPSPAPSCAPCLPSYAASSSSSPSCCSA